MNGQLQKMTVEWCARAFGAEETRNVLQRGIRFLEEAVELYQAVGGTAAMAHRLVDFVFARPVGEVAQEVGGVGVTLMALAEAAGLDAASEVKEEVCRVLSKSPEYFAARNAVKNKAGFSAI